MKSIKYIVYLAIALSASQGRSFDFASAAVKAAASIIQETPAPHRAQQGTQQPDVKLPAATGTFDTCRENFANGSPPILTGVMGARTRPLCFDGFAVMYSGDRKTPIYSAESLNRHRIDDARKESRTDVFFADARVPSGDRATLDDYRGSTFDRGHMAPAGDMATSNSMAQSFSLTNIVPQDAENNRNAWADIEKATRSYVRRAAGNVYVITGPVFAPGNCPIVEAATRALDARSISSEKRGNTPEGIVSAAVRLAGFKAPYRYDARACTIGHGVAVPSHLFKLVYDPSTNRAWAHWQENSPLARPGRPISYQELVRRTGIEFLPGVNPGS